jgi:Raf kinase inhibitor-like YbhB/YbcL family protein
VTLRGAAALLLGAAALCSPPRSPAQQPPAQDTNLRPIDQVLAAYGDSLMRLPGVVGVGIGRCGDAPCIKVMAARSSRELKDALPARLEGYPVELQVTGPIVARDAPEERMAFTLTSTAFGESAAIPTKHTCDGPDISPALAWSGAPGGAKAFALIADDPDAPAGTWVHWVLFNVVGTTLPENVPKTETLSNLGGTLQGRNDFRKIGYGGPCPPPGKPHRYFFKLYALDGPLPLKAGATKADVERAMQGHALGHAQLMGTYARRTH